MLSRCFLDFSVGVRASVIGLSQISSFSLNNRNVNMVHGRSFFFYFYSVIVKGHGITLVNIKPIQAYTNENHL